MSLLEQLAINDKELGISAVHDRAPEAKLAYVDAQIDEMKAIMWRERCDLLLNAAMERRTDEEAEALDARAREMKANIKRMVRAVDTLVAIRNELQA